jgi:hypothetical protein
MPHSKVMECLRTQMGYGRMVPCCCCVVAGVVLVVVAAAVVVVVEILRHEAPAVSVAILRKT